MATSTDGYVLATSGARTVVFAVDSLQLSSVVTGLGGTRLDSPTVDMTRAGYAKGGVARLTFSGSTPKTLDLTDLTSNTDSNDGDATYAEWGQLILYNDGAQPVAVAPGASNGLTGAGTMTLEAGEVVIWKKGTAKTVDSTHKTLDLTPASGGSLVVVVGGA